MERAEFKAWAAFVAERFSYSIRFLPVGPEDEVIGSPTQMAVFELNTDRLASYRAAHGEIHSHYALIAPWSRM